MCYKKGSQRNRSDFSKQEKNMDFPYSLSQPYFGGNTLGNYFTAVLAGVLLFLFFKFFIVYIVKKLKELAKKTNTDLDDLLAELLDKSIWPIFVILFLVGLVSFLSVPPIYNSTVNTALMILFIWQAMRIFSEVVDYFFKKYSQSHKETGRQYLSFFGGGVKIAAWSIAAVLIIDNLGYDVSSLVAGLGIGGIAVALAAQNILGDLFCSLSIYLDKPFKVGDFIVIGNMKGTVEKIGLKSTRITSLKGEEVIFSNRNLTESQINNFGKMKERRVAVEIGVTYMTNSAKLIKISQIAKKIIEETKNTRFDRAHFFRFGPCSLDYEIVYFVKTPDYNSYMDLNQEVNLKLKDAIEKEGIEFAYPTQTIFLAK